MHWLTRKKKGIGALLTFMLVVQNMLFFIYFMPGSGTRFSMISV
nr:hypothetical protein T07_3667 [Ipomoea batatas]